METTPVVVRDATREDLPRITAIYNHAVLTSPATMDTEPATPEKQEAWFDHHGGRFPVLVAETAAGVVGWASLSPWMERGAYLHTSEASVYVDEPHRRLGYGEALMRAVIERALRVNQHVVIARVVKSNTNSYELVRRLGFEDVGTIREVGRKFGRWIDMRVLQLLLSCEPGRQTRP